MGGLLDELGKRLAERWLTLLVLPGAMYLAVVTTAWTLRVPANALDLGMLVDRIGEWAADPVAATFGGQVIGLLAALLGAAGAGLAAQSLGALVRRAALAEDWQAWPRPLRTVAAWRVNARQARWDACYTTYHELKGAAQATSGPRPDPTERYRAYADMRATSVERPDRPTWSGDRVHSAAVRVERELQVPLLTIWPYVWLVLPDAARGEVGGAREALDRAGVLGGWALLYLPLGVLWWPALVLSAALAMLARQRVRASADAYAQLVEAATRMHLADVAQRMGIDTGKASSAVGATLSARLDVSADPPPRTRSEASEQTEAP